MGLWVLPKNDEEEREKITNQMLIVDDLACKVDSGGYERKACMVIGGSGGLFTLTLAALGEFVWHRPDIVVTGLGFSAVFWGIAAVAGVVQATYILNYNHEVNKLAFSKGCTDPEEILDMKIGFKNKRRLLPKIKALKQKQQDVEQEK